MTAYELVGALGGCLDLRSKSVFGVFNSSNQFQISIPQFLKSFDKFLSQNEKFRSIFEENSLSLIQFLM